MPALTRVLIVDDENMIQSVLRSLLDWENEGFILVGFADNGKEALDIVKNVQPQIVITDVAMPVMDGVELTRNLKDLYPQIGVIVLSGFDNFAYVREAMKCGAFDYVLKSELTGENLLLRLHQLSACLPVTQGCEVPLTRYQFLYNLIRQYYTSEHFIHEQLDRFHISLDLAAPLFLIRGICIGCQEAHVHIADVRRNLIAALAAIDRVVVFSSDDACFLLGNYSQLPAARAVLERVYGGDERCLWAVSPPIRSLGEFGYAIEYFRQGGNQFFYLPQQHIFSYRPELSYEAIGDISFSDLENAVDGLAFDSIRERIESFLEECACNKRREPYHVRKNCEHAIYCVLNRLEQQQYEIAELETNKLIFFRRIETTPTLESLRGVIADILSEIEGCISVKADGEAPLRQQIDRYLAEHYREDVKLSDVALLVHLTYHYLSRTFKKVYGENFSDYLDRIRIQAARDLLDVSGESIAEIAEKVGFTDQSYFGKIFRKLTGQSPRGYRSRLRG